jgi:molybdopterin synthase catalytic subunit
MSQPHLVRTPISAEALLDRVASEAHGAAALFLGTVRNQNAGRAVTGMEYSAYEPMAERELACIVAEVRNVFGVESVALEHRLGTLALGEVSVGVAVGHARRAPAFDAVRFAVEELKRRVPIWKREHYVDGTREWVDPTR